MNPSEKALRQRLADRLSLRDVRGYVDDSVAAMLPGLIDDDDDRVAFNSLWILTHFPADSLRAMFPCRDRLVDLLLGCPDTGRRRLLLSLLSRLPVGIDDVRVDYLDWCLSKINTSEPCGIRALCVKEAYAQCRFYPELSAELRLVLEMSEDAGLSPGMRCVRDKVLGLIGR